MQVTNLTLTLTLNLNLGSHRDTSPHESVGGGGGAFWTKVLVCFNNRQGSRMTMQRVCVCVCVSVFSFFPVFLWKSSVVMVAALDLLLETQLRLWVWETVRGHVILDCSSCSPQSYNSWSYLT